MLSILALNKSQSTLGNHYKKYSQKFLFLIRIQQMLVLHLKMMSIYRHLGNRLGFWDI